jgi:PhzF family phenazine biosynthesis protein
MPKLTAGIIDVFADYTLSGNPLAVIEDADGLSDTAMKLVAREFNQSETTFLLKPRIPGADWSLRSFTASGYEVTGAGHNALGAWLWMGYRGLLGALASPTSFQQEIGGRISSVIVSRDGDVITATLAQSPLALGHCLADVTELAYSLGLASQDILPGAQVASTGAAHFLVEASNKAAVDRASPDAARLLAVLSDVGAQGCYLYAPSEDSSFNQCYARFFNPTAGLWEDPATGSAAGPLVAWLLKQGRLESGTQVLVEQGTKMGRRSMIELKASPTVELSGTGIIVLQGELHLSDRA